LLQSHTCSVFLFLFCSHRNKLADFAIKHFRFFAITHYPRLQSYSKQPSSFSTTQTKSEFLFVQPHITTGCNQSRQIVAITHWFSFLFLFWSHRNKPAAFCNHSL
jgi:hypothetical protein